MISPENYFETPLSPPMTTIKALFQTATLLSFVKASVLSQRDPNIQSAIADIKKPVSLDTVLEESKLNERLRSDGSTTEESDEDSIEERLFTLEDMEADVDTLIERYMATEELERMALLLAELQTRLRFSTHGSPAHTRLTNFFHPPKPITKLKDFLQALDKFSHEDDMTDPAHSIYGSLFAIYYKLGQQEQNCAGPLRAGITKAAAEFRRRFPEAAAKSMQVAAAELSGDRPSGFGLFNLEVASSVPGTHLFRRKMQEKYIKLSEAAKVSA